MNTPSLKELLIAIRKFQDDFPEFEVVFELRLKSSATKATGIMDNWRKLHASDPPIACKLCGTLFQKTDPRQVFCSNDCNRKFHHDQRPKIEQKYVQCKQCHKTFLQNRIDHLYCDVKCQRDAERLRKGIIPVGKLSYKCKVCGKDFKKSSVAQKYCSNNCSRQARKSEKKTAYENNRIIIEARADRSRVCQHCHQQKKYKDFYPSSLSKCKKCQYAIRRHSTKPAIKKQCANCQKRTTKLYCSEECRKVAENNSKIELEKRLFPKLTKNNPIRNHQRIIEKYGVKMPKSVQEENQRKTQEVIERIKSEKSEPKSPIIKRGKNYDEWSMDNDLYNP